MVAKQIVERGGDYILALKGNYRQLHNDVHTLFADARTLQQGGCGMTSASTTESRHGRVERRCAFVISGPLISMALVEAEQTGCGVTTVEQRYYLFTQAQDAAAVNGLVRAHWSIENQLHWVLDVTIGG